MNMSFQEFLSSTSLEDFPFEGEVLVLQSTDTINHATKLLGERGFHSAPVFDKERNEYLGFFDVTDGLTMAVTVDIFATLIPQAWYDNTTTEKFLKVRKEEEVKLRDIFVEDEGTTDVLFLHPWKPLKVTDSLEKALEMLSTSKAKRIPVFDKHGNLKKLITLSQVTKVLDKFLNECEAKEGASYLNKLPNIFSEEVGNIHGLKKKEEIISIKASCELREAFGQLLEENVSAIAVVDEDGMLLSSISSTDVSILPTLETLVADRVKEKSPLDMSCEEFVKLNMKRHTMTADTKIPHVSVGEECTFRSIISKIAHTRKHRIWVTDSKKSVTSVLSVTDIADLLLKNK